MSYPSRGEDERFSNSRYFQNDIFSRVWRRRSGLTRVKVNPFDKAKSRSKTNYLSMTGERDSNNFGNIEEKKSMNKKLIKKKTKKTEERKEKNENWKKKKKVSTDLEDRWQNWCSFSFQTHGAFDRGESNWTVRSYKGILRPTRPFECSRISIKFL